MKTEIIVKDHEGNLLAVDETGQGKFKARARGVRVVKGTEIRFKLGTRPVIELRSNKATILSHQPLRIKLTENGAWADFKLRPIFGRSYTASVVRK